MTVFVRVTMKNIRDFLAFSNAFVSLCVAALCALSMLLAQTGWNHPLLMLVFCCTFFVYNFHHLYGMSRMTEKPTGARKLWSKRHTKTLKTLMYAAGIASLLLLWQISIFSIILLLLLTLIVLGYSIPFLPFKKHRRLRDLPFVKVFLVSFVVSALTVSIPLLEANGLTSSLSGEHALLFGVRFCFVLAITIPFDIRDLYDDRKYNIKTLPAVLGIAVAKIVSLSCLLLFCALAAWQLSLSGRLQIAFVIVLLLSAAFSATSIARTGLHRDEQHYTYMLEGGMLLQFALFFLADLLGAV